MFQNEIYKFSDNRKQIILSTVVGTVTTYYIGLCDREDYKVSTDTAKSTWKITRITIDSATGIIEQSRPIVDGVVLLDFECVRDNVATYTYL